MRTVNYINVLNGSADLCGLDRNNISALDFAQIRQGHDRRIATAYEYDIWPELTRTEKRYYRRIYAGATAYTVTNEVYYPATGKYYQALTSTTGNAPADSSGVVASTYWAESKPNYAASEYSGSTAYARGDQVFYSSTDRYYQLHAATSTGNLPTDTTKWGVLTEFDRYVAYEQTGYTAIGAVLDVRDANPKLTTRGEEVNWFLSENGVQVLTPTSYAFVTYKVRPARLTGANYSNTTAYIAGDQVYYSVAGSLPGNFYDCIANSTGNTPEDTDFWTRVDIPLIFQRYLEYGGYADWLRNAGQTERADAADAMADRELANQSQFLVGQQQQTKRTTVLTR